MDTKVERTAEVTAAQIRAAPPAKPRYKLSPLNERRLRAFKANKRGYYSVIVFMALFLISLFAEFIANDKPFLVKYDGAYYMPIFKMYTEKQFGGEFETEADYRDPAVQQFIREKGGWMIWPLDPLQLPHDQARPAGARARAAFMGESARHRRPGPRRGGARDLRLPHFGAVRLDLDRILRACRRNGGRGAGLFRRLDRSFAATLHRNPGLAAAPLYPADSVRDFRAEFLDAARDHALVRVDRVCRAGARRVPARPEFRICARGAGARACPTGRSCSSICCRMRWWRP